MTWLCFGQQLVLTLWENPCIDRVRCVLQFAELVIDWRGCDYASQPKSWCVHVCTPCNFCLHHYILAFMDSYRPWLKGFECDFLFFVLDAALSIFFVPWCFSQCNLISYQFIGFIVFVVYLHVHDHHSAQTHTVCNLYALAQSITTFWPVSLFALVGDHFGYLISCRLWRGCSITRVSFCRFMITWTLLKFLTIICGIMDHHRTENLSVQSFDSFAHSYLTVYWMSTCSLCRWRICGTILSLSSRISAYTLRL